MSEVEYVWILSDGGCEGERIEGVFKSFDDGFGVFYRLVEDYTKTYQQSFKKQKAERDLLKETDYDQWCRYYRFSELELYLNGPKENDDFDWEFNYGFVSGGGGWVTLKKFELK